MERGFFFKKKKLICSFKANELHLAQNGWHAKCLNLGTLNEQMPKDVNLGTLNKQMPKDAKNV